MGGRLVSTNGTADDLLRKRNVRDLAKKKNKKNDHIKRERQNNFVQNIYKRVYII